MRDETTKGRYLCNDSNGQLCKHLRCSMTHIKVSPAPASPASLASFALANGRLPTVKASKASKGEGFSLAHDTPAVKASPVKAKGKKGKVRKGIPGVQGAIKGETSADAAGLINMSRGAETRFAPDAIVVEAVSTTRVTAEQDSMARARVALGDARKAIALALGGSEDGGARRRSAALDSIVVAWRSLAAAPSAPSAWELLFWAASLGSPSSVADAFARADLPPAASPTLAARPVVKSFADFTASKRTVGGASLADILAARAARIAG